MTYILSNMDTAVLFWLQQNVVNSAWTPLMILISDLAKGGALWILLGVGLCFRKEYRSVGITLLFTLLMVGILGEGLLKHVIMRTRPCLDYAWMPMAIVPPAFTDYSFPSCHSYASFAAATVLYCFRKKWGIPAFLLAACIAFSRLYLFVHYPSDVVAGALLGIGTAGGSMLLLHYIQLKGWVQKGLAMLFFPKKEK